MWNPVFSLFPYLSMLLDSLFRKSASAHFRNYLAANMVMRTLVQNGCVFYFIIISFLIYDLTQLFYMFFLFFSLYPLMWIMFKVCIQKHIGSSRKRLLKTILLLQFKLYDNDLHKSKLSLSLSLSIFLLVSSRNIGYPENVRATRQWVEKSDSVENVLFARKHIAWEKRRYKKYFI